MLSLEQKLRERRERRPARHQRGHGGSDIVGRIPLLKKVNTVSSQEERERRTRMMHSETPWMGSRLALNAACESDLRQHEGFRTNGNPYLE